MEKQPMPSDPFISSPMPWKQNIRDTTILGTSIEARSPTITDMDTAANDDTYDNDPMIREKLKFPGNPVGAIPYLRNAPLHPQISSDMYCKEIKAPDPTNVREASFAYRCEPPKSIDKKEIKKLKKRPKFEYMSVSTTTDTKSKNTQTKFIMLMLALGFLYVMQK